MFDVIHTDNCNINCHNIEYNVYMHKYNYINNSYVYKVYSTMHRL